MARESRIVYHFKLEDGTIHQFNVDVHRMFDSSENQRPHPEWARLEFNQCSQCPLKKNDFPWCPVALDVEEIAVKFRAILSSAKAEVRVDTPDRTYLKECDVQLGLRSLLGLVMATSACPILSQLRNMAFYHLPFATHEETLVRAAGSYLLKQYLLFKDGKLPDLDLKGLDQLYKELMNVNKCFKMRLDSISEKDANMNALVSLFSLSMGVTFSLEENLRELKHHL